ncbi:MAG: PDZ domain-containing protein [Chitinophagales bacterium]|nr:PDZ domain-containing protein [Chitinophagales bacterium]
MRIIYLLFTVLFAIEVSGQAAIARLKFEDAEEAFNKGDYTTTLSKLEDAEKLFGKINVPILHLRIVSQDKLLQKKLDFSMLANLRKNCEQFLIDYETMEGIEEKYRQVYKIQESYAKYPKTMEEYQKLVAEKNAEEEAKRELARKNATVKVYLFRSTGFAASAVGFQVFQDGQVVGRISNKEYLSFDVLPGRHSFGAQDGRSTEIKRKTELTEIDVLPETPVFLEVDYNKWNGDLDVVTITKEKAKEYFEKLKPGENRVVTNNRSSDAFGLVGSVAAASKTASASSQSIYLAPNSLSFIGITTQSVSITLLVTSVTPGSPAAKADIKVNDIIVTINNEIANSPKTINQLKERFLVSKEMTIQLIRNESPMEVKVFLEKQAAIGRG